MKDSKTQATRPYENELDTGADLAIEQSGIKVADVINLQATQRDDRNVLFKIDR